MDNFISIDQVIEILGRTIKKDEANKILVFLAMLLSYTEEAQINISFIAPSSSGKSFIPLEVAKFFPSEDILKLGNCSPNAFFHEQGTYEDKEKTVIVVDLSKKIIIFLDQPGPELLARLRALLSHDDKIIVSKITDKNQRGGNRTKTVKIIGFPVVIFCSANLRMDEQESTRMLVLSPEVDPEKIRQGISESIKKSTDRASYSAQLDNDPERQQLKNRVLAIKEANIKDVKIRNRKLVEEKFSEIALNPKPRQLRDVVRIIDIVKGVSLLNFSLKERVGDVISAEDQDIEDGFMLWSLVSESQELNLSPYVYDVYQQVILKLFLEKNSADKTGAELALTKKEIIGRHYQIYGRAIPDWQLTKDILPVLESAGLVSLEKDSREGHDHRQLLIYPTTQFDKSPEPGQNNVGTDGGVNASQPQEEPWQCRACGSHDYWKRADGEAVCTICHPNAQGIEEALEGVAS